MYTRAITLSVGATPPREFQIFKAGLNSTAKGTFNFDAEAARQVMAAHAKAGAIDLPIDLEHDSLSAERRALRSDAGDARGWFQLALRPDGSLWAVNVRWTKDGTRRLQERTQRFISPAFAHEGERPTHLINCALVSQPATHGAQALVAASKTARVGARISPAARAQLYVLAAKRKTTISAVLLSALDTLADSATVTPTPEAIAALKSLLVALDLKDAGQPEVIAAIRGLLDAADVPPETSNADPLQASPDPIPAQLARKPDAHGFTPNPSDAFPTTPAQQKQWVADRAAQRAKRAARSASTPQARGYDRAVKDAQVTRAEQSRRR